MTGSCNSLTSTLVGLGTSNLVKDNLSKDSARVDAGANLVYKNAAPTRESTTSVDIDDQIATTSIYIR